jgi:polynucleotide kinase-phosphatase
MKIAIPQLSLVTLIGVSGSGKTTFARKRFWPTEVLSTDYCRGLVADDENDQAATPAAFAALHFVAERRLEAGRLTVIDATNVRAEDRKGLVEIARRYHALPVAIVLNLPERICRERNRARPDRNFGGHVIANQLRTLRQSLRGLRKEGYSHVFVLDSQEQIDAVEIERTPLWCDRRREAGPFDVIGDVHGCMDELLDLLKALGYRFEEADQGVDVEPPAGRKAIFVGDLVDRGPNAPGVLKLAMRMSAQGRALCVPGNHDIKLLRKLRGKDVQIAHGLQQTLDQLEGEDEGVRAAMADFIDGLVSHYVLDSGRLVVAHAGMKEEMQGRGSAKVRDFALYGETTGEVDDYGLPVRLNWAADYRGEALVVHGHVAVPEVVRLNRTINIDTGCVYGGKLTAYRYPEDELVSVPARRTYYEPIRPAAKTPAASDTVLSVQQHVDDTLDLEDVLGKRIIETRLRSGITVQTENAVAALEVMSRFAVNPKWLIYLPPTMSPPETSRREGYLEHPDEAFAYFRGEGVERVICEKKHMGSRAIVVLCRDETVAAKRFGIQGEGFGACFTRTGRPFFSDPALGNAFLERVCHAMDEAEFWSQHQTDWACLDCELMPWSAKAQALLRTQYAATGAAARSGLGAAVAALENAAGDVPEVEELLQRYRRRAGRAERFVESYRRYCWGVQSLDDYKLAPFHLLATEGAVHADKPHEWHMQELAAVCDRDGQLLLATPYRCVDLSNQDQVEEAVKWWLDLTAAGGEGMVVKPDTFLAKGRRGPAQPAIKCRGREYLRIIYGPEYTAEESLDRLRSRSVGRKRSLAIRELSLGLEALERFVKREPLRRVHECVFAVLALESEPIDPRL